MKRTKVVVRRVVLVIFNPRFVSVDLGGRENGSTPLAVARKFVGGLNGDNDE